MIYKGGSSFGLYGAVAQHVGGLGRPAALSLVLVTLVVSKNTSFVVDLPVSYLIN